MRNRTENQINLILIRHGETPSNALGRYLGRTEEDLSEAGKGKLLLSKKAGKYPEADILFSSPMKRCRQTAGLLYEDKAPILIDDWREMDFGRFEGKSYLELNGDMQYQAWIDSNGELPFPDGEGREEFILRCRKGLRKALQELAGYGLTENGLIRTERTVQVQGLPVTAAAVIHGGSIMALLSAYCGGDYFDYRCKNGEGYICRLMGGKELSIEIIREL